MKKTIVLVVDFMSKTLVYKTELANTGTKKDKEELVKIEEHISSLEMKLEKEKGVTNKKVA